MESNWIKDKKEEEKQSRLSTKRIVAEKQLENGTIIRQTKKVKEKEIVDLGSVKNPNKEIVSFSYDVEEDELEGGD